MSRSCNKLISVGVDVGTVNGAIAVVSEELKILLLTKAPTYQTELKSRRTKSKVNKETGMYEKGYRKRSWVDFNEVGKLLKPYESKEVIYTIEKLIPRSEERESSSFVNGNSLGIFQAMNVILSPVRYYEPLPQSWKKELGVTSDKSSSIKLAEDIYQVNLKDYVEKGKVDDVAEALLLAFYGLMNYFKEKGE